jgi:hypothetical protein
MKMMIKAIITVARANIHPSVIQVELEEEYNPYLEQRWSRRV